MWPCLIQPKFAKRRRLIFFSYFFLECSNDSVCEVWSALVRFTARFSLSDLPDFLVMPCLGDLSDITAPLTLGACSGPDRASVRPLRSAVAVLAPQTTVEKRPGKSSACCHGHLDRVEAKSFAVQAAIAGLSGFELMAGVSRSESKSAVEWTRPAPL